MSRRALTLAQKRAVLDRLFDCWAMNPELRFGQMLTAAIGDRDASGRRGACFSLLFNIEDYDLADTVFMFAEGIDGR